MRIVICDDDPSFTAALKTLIKNETSARDIKPDFLIFHSGEQLLADLSGISTCDAIFLDIDMPEVSGFDIAQRINDAGETFIIFVTSYDELVYSSIKFRPFRFIRKSHLSEELPEVLDALSTAVRKRTAGRRFRLRSGTADIFINVGEIKYLESFAHQIRVYLSDNKIIDCYGSLSEMEKQLSDFDFVRVHRSYLVNCRYIYSIERGQVLLTDKTELPLSRYKSEQVKSKVKNFILSEI